MHKIAATLAASLLFVLAHPSAIAMTQEEADDQASLAEDQTTPSESSMTDAGAAATDPAASAAAAGVLPVINIKPRDPNSLDPGTLCQSKFAQRSPICAAKR